MTRKTPDMADKIWTKEDVEGALQDLDDVSEDLKSNTSIEQTVIQEKLKNARAALLDYSSILD